MSQEDLSNMAPGGELPAAVTQADSVRAPWRRPTLICISLQRTFGIGGSNIDGASGSFA